MFRFHRMKNFTIILVLRHDTIERLGNVSTPKITRFENLLLFKLSINPLTNSTIEFVTSFPGRRERFIYIDRLLINPPNNLYVSIYQRDEIVKTKGKNVKYKTNCLFSFSPRLSPT